MRSLTQGIMRARGFLIDKQLIFYALKEYDENVSIEDLYQKSYR